MFNKTRGYEFRFNHYCHDRKRWDNREGGQHELKQTPPIKIKLKTKYSTFNAVESIIKNAWNLERLRKAKEKIKAYNKITSTSKYRQRNLEYKQKNRDAINKWYREYYHKNKKIISRKRKEYYLITRETRLKQANEYYAKNKEKIRRRRKWLKKFKK